MNRNKDLLIQAINHIERALRIIGQILEIDGVIDVTTPDTTDAFKTDISEKAKNLKGSH